MTATENKPVVVGSGLTGMAISDRLARADVPHVLLGDPPDGRPRLGVSLDAAGTLQLMESYPEFDDYYSKKQRARLFTGDYVLTCDFSQILAGSVSLRLMGFRPPPELIDVDRVGFDRALHDKVVANECCTRIESRVDGVEYDHESDTIETVRLQSGEPLQPGYVFDCTNVVRLVGRALDVPVDWLGEPQRVVFTDYRAPPEAIGRIDDSVKHADHLVHLYDDVDGIDGLAWAIPLGSYVSVGISMPYGHDDLGGREVLARVEDAYRRRGMDLLDVVGEPKPAVDVPRQQYFVHERAFGKNWLLAGSSYGQFWFPSASGVSTSLVAADLAPGVLRRPEAAPRKYEDYVDGLRETHRVFEGMITRDRDETTREAVEREIDHIIAENVKRVGRLATVRNGPLTAGVARLFAKAASFDGVVDGHCDVYDAEPTDQARTGDARE